MNVHIIQNQKFTEKFIKLAKEHYSLNEHRIYVYGNENGQCNVQGENVSYIDSFKSIDLTCLGSKDKLFIHGFYDRGLIRYLYLKCKRINRSQFVMIIWGADLYDVHYRVQDGEATLKDRVYEYLKRRIVEQASIFMTFAANDYDLAVEWYGAKGKQFDCLYPSNADVELLDYLKNCRYKDETIRVLVGNSATKTNQHFDIIKVLSKFANEDIEILCPLSYGDFEYGRKVEKLGISIFGKKFVPIKEYMTSGKYCELLNKVDVAIFNNNRQQGTGNIEILGYLGKKIFVRSDTTTWKHYVGRDRCIFFDVLMIGDMTFKDFKEFSDEDKMINENYFQKIWDINYVKSLWDDVINY